MGFPLLLLLYFPIEVFFSLFFIFLFQSSQRRGTSGSKQSCSQSPPLIRLGNHLGGGRRFHYTRLLLDIKPTRIHNSASADLMFNLQTVNLPKETRRGSIRFCICLNGIATQLHSTEEREHKRDEDRRERYSWWIYVKINRENKEKNKKC